METITLTIPATDKTITLNAKDVPGKYAKAIEQAANTYNTESEIRNILSMVMEMPDASHRLEEMVTVSADNKTKEGREKIEQGKNLVAGICSAVASGRKTVDEAIKILGLSSSKETRFVQACTVLQSFVPTPCNSHLTEDERALLNEQPSMDAGFWSEQLTLAVVDAAQRFCGAVGITLATY